MPFDHGHGHQGLGQALGACLGNIAAMFPAETATRPGDDDDGKEPSLALLLRSGSGFKFTQNGSLVVKAVDGTPVHT
jgi:hypothetical protein